MTRPSVGAPERPPAAPSSSSPPASAEPPSSVPPWLPDLGDGTYRNPVLFADYSDPDAIRVGDDFWLTSSSFNHTPGLPILHSRDLVNWTVVNHALPRLVPVDHFATPRHGGGVWAPSIRYHGGKYYIFYPDPDFGLYVVSTDDPRSPWSAPVLVKGGKGLIDPCPLWDTDGRAYLIHAWAKSRAGIKNRLTLHRMDPVSFQLLDAGTVIIDGDQMPGWTTIEGPKLYRRGEYYYVFAPAGGVTDGYQAVFRARDPFGPYENRIVLARGTTQVNGPHQGAWVGTAAGTDWFLHFQEVPAYGRIVHLQPVRWVNDWPVMGDDPDGDGTGQPVAVAPKPVLAATPRSGPATSDEFNADALAPIWQWQGNPQDTWADLRARRGWLRLRCASVAPEATLWSATHLLMQKLPAPEFEATAALEFSPTAEGDFAGLVVFGFSYAALGLVRRGDGLSLVLRVCDQAHQGGREREAATVAGVGPSVRLRVRMTAGARCQFSFSVDGRIYQPIGETFQATSSYWVGAKVGLFASTSAQGAQPAHADFDWFRLTSLSS